MEHLGKQFQGALEALKATKVDILYLHAPEPDTPIEVTLQAINTLYQDGLFDRVSELPMTQCPICERKLSRHHILSLTKNCNDLTSSDCPTIHLGTWR
jgi:aryl-alcohol dehydrogenase-like predicted oxidoreductase